MISKTATSTNGRTQPAKQRTRADQSEGRKASTIATVVLVVIILLGGGVFTRFWPAAAATGPVPVLTVATELVQPSSGYQVKRGFVGRVEGRRESPLSFELGGKVIEVTADEGDPVTMGQVLARLDTELLQAQRESAAAAVSSARATLEEFVEGPRKEDIEAAKAEVAYWVAQTNLARNTHARNTELVDTKAITEQQFDDTKFREVAELAQLRRAEATLLELENGTREEQIESQRALVDQLQAALEVIDIQLKKSVLLASFDGTVAERAIDEGTVVDAGTAILRLIETSQLEARIGVANSAVDELRRGTVHELDVDGLLVSGTVKSIRPDRDQRTRTVSVIFTLADTEHPISTGDIATLRLSHEVEQPGFWLPRGALTESYRGLWSAFVATQTDTAAASRGSYSLAQRELELIHEESNRVYVRGSLKPGELVVTDGIHRLVPNQEVRLAGAAPDEESQLALGH